MFPSSKGPEYPRLADLTKPHIDAFNSVFPEFDKAGLLMKAIQDIPPLVVYDMPQDRSKPLDDCNRLEIYVESVSVSKPFIEGSSRNASSAALFPSECRERGISYKAKMEATVVWRVNNGPVNKEIKPLGMFPIMVSSAKCNLYGYSPKDLVKRHEAPDEMGGYFITNGIERLIRLLIVQRRNHPLAIIRPSFGNRGHSYSKFGVSIRCVRQDQTSQTVTLHYCTDGMATVRFSYRKNEYMVPVMLVLRALSQTSDKQLFERLTMAKQQNTSLVDSVELLLRSFRTSFAVLTRHQALSYLGQKFAVMLDCPEDMTQLDAGLELLRRVVLVHLTNDSDKFDLLIYMLQKLYALAHGECAADNPDSLQCQETLLGGHLMLAITKEKIGEWLATLKQTVLKDIRNSYVHLDFHKKEYMQKVFQRSSSAQDIGRKLQYFLSTGNIVSSSGLDLQQTSGYTVVAEKLNFYRYISHFRSIHRGSFFAELKTTTVRKLLPESWGFLCPVHTPDGSPCGLLNHLSHSCKIVVENIDVKHIPGLVASLGVSQINGLGPQIVNEAKEDTKHEDPVEIVKNLGETLLTVQLDGKVIGWCSASTAKRVAQTLRDWKVKKMHNVPLSLEIGYVPPSIGGQFPGLFLFSTPARMIRSVKYLPTGTEDLVGPFEQVYMDIACMDEDVVVGKTTHQEFSPTTILSVVANLTPFSDFNQSPRNMYQCQMGKQTMGTPAQNLYHRTDNKLYRLQTGQTPIVRPALHDEYGLDSYPHGMNAVVCVISYTGYDMEDASIIAKSAYERGYGYGTIYKSEWIDIKDGHGDGECNFGFFIEGEDSVRLSDEELQHVMQFIDEDGLPRVGVRLSNGDPYYAYVDDTLKKLKIAKFKGTEVCYVDQVRLVGTDACNEPLSKINVKFRIPRPPVIGDKFSSRHGQKGVISQKWPSVDMPFSETGIIPDVIINPHAFPSRMTIGMFVESLAGKAGALHGYSQDSTPFKFNEDNSAADFFGEELVKAGFNFHGNEPMYSGTYGCEFKADIYIGVIYYQRLRHMVSDKFQVRTMGPVHNLTHQPVKGRKRAGGIRFGEMERDSLLAHGVSFLLQDRLMNCSDYTQSYVCKACGSLVSPINLDSTGKDDGSFRKGVMCKICGDNRGIQIIAVPYVFRYLCTELAVMNVKLKLDIQDV